MNPGTLAPCPLPGPLLASGQLSYVKARPVPRLVSCRYVYGYTIDWKSHLPFFTARNTTGLMASPFSMVTGPVTT